MTTIYWAGGEDCDMYQVAGGAVSTTAGRFRSTYARCGLETSAGGGATPPYWQNWLAFSASTFWHSCRLYTSGNGTTNSNRLLAWCDSASVERLRIVGTGTAGQYRVETINNASTVTQLGSNFTMSLSAGVTVDKLDVYIVYNAVGTITIYLNGIQYFTYSGDVTTNGATAVANIRQGTPGSSPFVVWSEIIIADTDTRSWNLQTLAPVANGNTHNFDTGTPAAANVNEVTLNDATLDGSTTAGQVDQYTIPAIAGGTYTIMAIGVSARMQKGSSGPSKMDLNVRVAGTDYFSADQTLTTAWADYQNWWLTDPNTAAVWSALPTNIGLKSVT